MKLFCLLLLPSSRTSQRKCPFNPALLSFLYPASKDSLVQIKTSYPKTKMTPTSKRRFRRLTSFSNFEGTAPYSGVEKATYVRATILTKTADLLHISGLFIDDVLHPRGMNNFGQDMMDIKKNRTWQWHILSTCGATEPYSLAVREYRGYVVGESGVFFQPVDVGIALIEKKRY